MAIAFFLILIYLAWEFAQGYLSHKWPTMHGVIIKSKLVTYKKSKKMKTPCIVYKYTVDKNEHYSRRVALYITKPLSNKEAQELIERYPEGKKVIVKYHPLFHSFAVLETGQRQIAIRLYMFFIFLLFFSALVMAIYKPDFILIFEAIRYFNE